MSKHDQHGVQFKLSDGTASPTLTTVAQVVSLRPPNMTRETFAAATHDDTGFIKYLTNALKEGGEVVLGLAWDPAAATHDPTTGLLEAFVTGDERDNQIVFPDTGSTTWTVPSIVTGFSPDDIVANGGLLTTNVTIKVTDDPTLA